MKEIDLSTIKLGTMRVRKNGGTVYVQEYVHGGWEYTQLHSNQTLTSVIDELNRRGYEFLGRDHHKFYYYARSESALTIPAEAIENGIWIRPYYDTIAGAWRDPIVGLFDENGVLP